MFFSVISVQDFFKKIIYLFSILSILSSFCLLLPVRNNNILSIYENSAYDYILQGTSKDQYKSIMEMDFIEHAFPFSIISSTISANDMTSDITLFAVENLEGIEFSAFSERTLIKTSNQYNEQNNQIFIDYKLAKDFNLTIGSIVELPFGSEMTPISFVVSRIYEPHQMYGKYDALIIWDGKHKEIYEKEFENEIGYSHLFIKASDNNLFEEYIHDEYIPLGLVKDETSVDSFDRSEIETLCEKRIERLNGEIRMLQYTPPVVAITSFLGGVVFFLFVCKEQNKKFDLYKKDFCILNLLGYSYKKLSILFFLDSIILQVPVAIFSLLMVKYGIYNLLSGSNYLSYDLLYKALIVEIIGIIIISIVCSFVIYIKLKKTKLVELLAKE